jgi:hypothetical protein
MGILSRVGFISKRNAVFVIIRDFSTISMAKMAAMPETGYLR